MSTFPYAGYDIGINTNGYFGTKLPGEDRPEWFPTLREAKGHIDKRTTVKKRKRPEYKTSCLVKLGMEFIVAKYRGLHSTTGNVLISVNGKKESVDKYNIFAAPRSTLDLEEQLEKVYAAQRALQDWNSFCYRLKVKVPYVSNRSTVDALEEAEKLFNAELQRVHDDHIG